MRNQPQSDSTSLSKFAIGERKYKGGTLSLAHVFCAKDEADARKKLNVYRYHHRLRAEDCDLIPIAGYEHYEPATFWPLTDDAGGF